MVRLLISAIAVTLLTGCALFTSLPRASGPSDRLATLPTKGLPLDGPVDIYWDEHLIPFIEASTDHDAAFALGLVHAHLRLGQMELLRRISQGRVAEMGGPLAISIDHSLRILDLGKASSAVVAAMPPESRAWLDAFVAGINHYQASVETLPHEYALLGLEREPWRPEELLTIGRLGSIDVTWLIWFRLLGLRDSPEWATLWRRAVGAGGSSAPSFNVEAPPSLEQLEALLTSTSKTGSNSVAIAKSRSATGGALIASDPHLGISLPNLWLIAGIKSPSYHMVGMMVPGLPFVAVGRNQDIAWGGTNLRSASSDLFDISALPEDQIATRTETIGVRWWFDREVELRETRYGPVVSDAPVLPHKDGQRIALRWIGHRPSDELSAMLALNRARDWQEFRRALAGFALSPQNFVYADARGNVGQLTAAQLPLRPSVPPDDMIRPIGEAALWEHVVTTENLPWIYNPAEGFVASANNRPADAGLLIGYFFSNDDRVLRLQERLRAKSDWQVDDLRRLQMDTHRRSAVILRDALLARLQAVATPPAPNGRERQVLDLIAGWDGIYDASSQGALAFEALMAGFVATMYDESTRTILDTGGNLYDFAAEDVAQMAEAPFVAALGAALPDAVKAVETYGTWGEMHRLPVQHLLGAVPLIGGRYRFSDLPTPGSNDTIFKTAHSLAAERHDTRYGTQSRHISDMSDPDANWFVLLGGQDGWFNSSTFADQVDLFMKGELIQVPLRLDTVRATFKHHQRLGR
ncbi:MAG: penicillin acylase family protein [Alphaproteobacteria bacterium]